METDAEIVEEFLFKSKKIKAKPVEDEKARTQQWQQQTQFRK